MQKANRPDASEAMHERHGLFWPDGISNEAYLNALHYAKYAELVLPLCHAGTRCIQAGGNIGLFPLRFAKFFSEVHTFEPDPLTRACLVKNIAGTGNIIVWPVALGSEFGACNLERQSLGSHHVSPGHEFTMAPIDECGIENVGLIQLDIEGYELHALRGARAVIERDRPVIQLELCNLSKHYGHSDKEITFWLRGLGYDPIQRVPKDDVIFLPR